MKSNLNEGYNNGDVSNENQSIPQVVQKGDTYEVFRYKVVYPGGTYLRISPAVDARKTGVILEYGTIFDASKSVFLDGVVYVKVSNGDGWVFESKNEVQILELQFIIRAPNKKKPKIDLENSDKSVSEFHTNGLVASTTSVSITTPVENSISRNVALSLSTTKSTSNSFGSCSNLSLQGSPLPVQRQQARVENRLWRDIRARCGACESFEAFLHLTAALDSSLISSQSQHEYRVLGCVNLIASITSQCSSHVMMQTQSRSKEANMGVGICLWVLVHMGSRVPHTMHLIVEAANIKFESVSIARQAQLLRIVSEVGIRTKSHATELGKQLDILPDDIRNFLQRWVIVQSMEEEKEAPIGNDINGTDDIADQGENEKEEEEDHYIGKADRNDYDVQKTPLSEPLRCIRFPSQWSLSLRTQLSSWLSGSDVRNSPYDICNSSNNYKSSIQMDRASSKEGGIGGSTNGLSEDSKDRKETQTLSKVLWREIENQLKKLADPDMQLAGLI